jgi:endonuclease/exonuclease/phosphatase family metal-dependent hydrolase
VAADVRIVSYNVHSLRDDLAALALVVRTLSPDILIIQEAPRRLRWRAKCAALAHSFGMYVAVGGLPSLGNLILTTLRVEVTGSWCLRYPLSPGRHMRGAAFLLCRVPGSAPFAVAGSHLSTNDTERPLQAALLKPALDASPAPVILGIDLNDTPFSPAHTLLTSPAPSTLPTSGPPPFASGDALSALPAPHSPTPLASRPPVSIPFDVAGAALVLPGSRPLIDLGADGNQNTFPARDPNRRIDFLFADPALTITSFAVHTSPPTQAASDHFPLLTTLSV